MVPALRMYGKLVGRVIGCHGAPVSQVRPSRSEPRGRAHVSFAASSSAPRPASQRRRRGPLLPTIGVLLGVIIGFLVLSRFWTEWLWRSEEHTSELQSRGHLVCRLLLEKKKKNGGCRARERHFDKS